MPWFAIAAAGLVAWAYWRKRQAERDAQLFGGYSTVKG